MFSDVKYLHVTKIQKNREVARFDSPLYFQYPPLSWKLPIQSFELPGSIRKHLE